MSLDLTHLLSEVVETAKSATAAISGVTTTVEILPFYNVRAIYTRRIDGKLYKGNAMVNEEETKCTNGDSKGICGMLATLISGASKPSEIKKLQSILGKTDVQVQQLEDATPAEIKALANGLRINYNNNETYEQWVAKIKANSGEYGFDPSTSRKYLKQSGGFSLDIIKQLAEALKKDNTTLDDSKILAAINTALGGKLKSLPTNTNNDFDNDQNKKIIDAMRSLSSGSTTQFDEAVAAVKVAVAAAAVPPPPSLSGSIDAAKAAASSNTELDNFFNNHSLQYFIVNFFKFIALNRAIFNKSADAPAAPARMSGALSFASSFGLRGGSITETILNTPSYSTQLGGNDSDMARIRQRLSQDVKLYSNGLRSELMQLTQQLDSINKPLDNGAKTALLNAIDKIAKDERNVLSAVLAGHQFLDAHQKYVMEGDNANTAATFENLMKISALLEGQQLKLKARTDQIALSLNNLFSQQPLLLAVNTVRP